MRRKDWIKEFTDEMMTLGVRAQREQIEALAGELLDQGASSEPREAAHHEWSVWPPHDD
jgi:hypothetical protein